MATNWGRFAGPFVAEHAILLALASLRNLSAWRPFMNLPPDGREVESLGTRSLLGRSVGLHGFGHIARALAGLLRPFGVTLRAFSAGVGDELIRMESVEPCASLEELFRHSEVLFECEALTATSERAVTAAVLSLLPDGAVFVNVGRGRLVDEAALMRETASGRIRAALDVTTETLAPDSPWLQLPGVILSPHIGGPSHDQYRHCGKMALDNIGRFLRGEPLSGLVTLEIYDRST